MVEAQLPPPREFLPEHSLCWLVTFGATTDIVPLKSLLTVRSSTQPRPEEGEATTTGEGEGEGVEVLVEVGTSLNVSAHIEVTEPPEEVVERMTAAVSEAVAAHPGGRIVMIGHGVAILHYLCDVMRIDFGALRIYPHFTGINTVRVL